MINEWEKIKKEMKEIQDRKWKIFWKRYKESYPEYYKVMHEVTTKIAEIFEKISPFVGEDRKGTWSIDKNGKVRATDIDFIMFGVIGKVALDKIKSDIDEIERKLDKIERYLQYAIPEIDKLIECPYCGAFNPPNVEFCTKCGKQLNKR